MRLPVLLTVLFCSIAAIADSTPPSYDRVEFSEQASADVDNDLLVAVLAVEMDGPRADRIANEVNRRMAAAIKRAKRTPGIQVQTQSYRTNAIYRDGSISGWRVSQSLRLESRDSKTLGDLIGELQQDLNVKSINYELSEQQRRQHEKQLVEQALQRFQERGEAIVQALGRKGFRIVRVSVHTGHRGPVPVRAEMMRTTSVMRVSPPAMEAGTQELQVTVNAEIELID